MTHLRPRIAGSPRALAGSVALSLALALSLLPLSASADSDVVQAPVAQPEAAQPEAAAVLPLGSEGLVIYRDAETGRFTSNPTDAQRALLRQALAQSMAASLSRSDAGLTEIALPNGGVMVRLEGRFQSASFLTRGDDNALHQACTHDLEILQDSLAGADAETKTEVEVNPATDSLGRAIQ